MDIVQSDIFSATVSQPGPIPFPTPIRPTASSSHSKISSTISHISVNVPTSVRPTINDTRFLTNSQISTGTQSSTSTTNTQFFTKPQSSIGTSISGTSLSTGPHLPRTDSQSSTKNSIPSTSAHTPTSASSSLVGVPSSTVITSFRIIGTSFINSINSISSTSAVSPPAGPPDPTQSSGTAGKSSGPIIGGIVGGIIAVALSALTVAIVIKRRRRRRRQRQNASLPTTNPLLANPHITELAAQRDLLEKGSRPFHLFQNPSVTSSGSSNDTQTRSQDQNQGPAFSPSPGNFESVMQRQMEMISTISQRMMVLEAHQLGHQARATEPPNYESHTPT